MRLHICTHVNYQVECDFMQKGKSIGQHKVFDMTFVCGHGDVLSYLIP